MIIIYEINWNKMAAVVEIDHKAIAEAFRVKNIDIYSMDGLLNLSDEWLSHFNKTLGLPENATRIDVIKVLSYLIAVYPKRQCVKVDRLRKKYGQDTNFSKWLEEDLTLYAGRYGRVFIDKEVFPYKGSKWANPFKVKGDTLEGSLAKYREYVESNPELMAALPELSGKYLGCWCFEENQCHTGVLIDLFKQHVGK